jgi:hypothetical protein
MSIIVFLICLMFLGAFVRVAFGAFKLILAVVFISVMVHSCDRSHAQESLASPACCGVAR